MATLTRGRKRFVPGQTNLYEDEKINKGLKKVSQLFENLNAQITLDDSGKVIDVLALDDDAENQINQWRKMNDADADADRFYKFGKYDFPIEKMQKSVFLSSLVDTSVKNPTTKTDKTFSMLENLGISNQGGVAQLTEAGKENYPKLMQKLSGEIDWNVPVTVRSEAGKLSQFNFRNQAALESEDVKTILNFLKTSPQMKDQIFIPEDKAQIRSFPIDPEDTVSEILDLETPSAWNAFEAKEQQELEKYMSFSETLKRSMKAGMTLDEVEGYKENPVLWMALTGLEMPTRAAGAAWGVLPDWIGDLDIGGIPVGAIIPDTESQNFFSADAGIFKGARDGIMAYTDEKEKEWIEQNPGIFEYKQDRKTYARNSRGKETVNTVDELEIRKNFFEGIEEVVPGFSRAFERMNDGMKTEDKNTGGSGKDNKSAEIFILNKIRSELASQMIKDTELAMENIPTDDYDETYGNILRHHELQPALEMIDKRTENLSREITYPGGKWRNSAIAAIRVFEDPGLLGFGVKLLGKQALKRTAPGKSLDNWISNTAGHLDAAQKAKLAASIRGNVPGADFVFEHLGNSPHAQKLFQSFMGDLGTSLKNKGKWLAEKKEAISPEEGSIFAIVKYITDDTIEKASKKAGISQADFIKSIEGDTQAALLRLKGMHGLRKIMTVGMWDKLAKNVGKGVNVARELRRSIFKKAEIELTEAEAKQTMEMVDWIFKGHIVDYVFKTRTKLAKDQINETLLNWDVRSLQKASEVGDDSAGGRLANSFFEPRVTLFDAERSFGQKIKHKDTYEIEGAPDYMNLIQQDEKYQLMLDAIRRGEAPAEIKKLVGENSENFTFRLEESPGGTSITISPKNEIGEQALGARKEIQFSLMGPEHSSKIMNGMYDVVGLDAKKRATTFEFNVGDSKYTIDKNGAVYESANPENVVGFVDRIPKEMPDGEIVYVVDPSSFTQNNVTSLLQRQSALQKRNQFTHTPEYADMREVLELAGDLSEESTQAIAQKMEQLWTLQYVETDKKNKVIEMFKSFVDSEDPQAVAEVASEMRKALKNGSKDQVRASLRKALEIQSNAVFDKLGIPYERLHTISGKELDKLVKTKKISRRDKYQLEKMISASREGRFGSLAEAMESHYSEILPEEVEALVHTYIANNTRNMSLAEAFDMKHQMRKMERRAGLHNAAPRGGDLTTYNESLLAVTRELDKQIQKRMQHKDIFNNITPEQQEMFFKKQDKYRTKAELLDRMSHVLGDYGGSIQGKEAMLVRSQKAQELMEMAAREVAEGTHTSPTSAFSLLYRYDDLLEESVMKGSKLNFFKEKGFKRFSEDAYWKGVAERRGYSFNPADETTGKNLGSIKTAEFKLVDDYDLIHGNMGRTKTKMATEVSKENKIPFMGKKRTTYVEDASSTQARQAERTAARRQALQRGAKGLFKIAYSKPSRAIRSMYSGWTMDDRKKLANVYVQENELDALKAMENGRLDVFNKYLLTAADLAGGTPFGEEDIDIDVSPLSRKYSFNMTRAKNYITQSMMGMAGEYKMINPNLLSKGARSNFSKKDGIEKDLSNPLMNASRMRLLKTLNGNYLVIGTDMSRDDNQIFFLPDDQEMSVKAFSSDEVSKAKAYANKLAKKRIKLIKGQGKFRGGQDYYRKSYEGDLSLKRQLANSTGVDTDMYNIR
jgi:hypothetical protein